MTAVRGFHLSTATGVAESSAPPSPNSSGQTGRMNTPPQAFGPDTAAHEAHEVRRLITQSPRGVPGEGRLKEEQGWQIRRGPAALAETRGDGPEGLPR